MSPLLGLAGIWPGPLPSSPARCSRPFSATPTARRSRLPRGRWRTVGRGGGLPTSPSPSRQRSEPPPPHLPHSHSSIMSRSPRCASCRAQRATAAVVPCHRCSSARLLLRPAPPRPPPPCARARSSSRRQGWPNRAILSATCAMATGLNPPWPEPLCPLPLLPMSALLSRTSCSPRLVSPWPATAPSPPYCRRRLPLPPVGLLRFTIDGVF
jgi:hypothetical protein